MPGISAESDRAAAADLGQVEAVQRRAPIPGTRANNTEVLHSLGRLGASARATLPPEPLARLATEVLAGLCAPLVADVLTKRWGRGSW